MTEARWTYRRRRMGTVHIVRWWEVSRDGVAIDCYDEEEFAKAYCDYMNARSATICSASSHPDRGAKA
jgi:hypothetical protein